MIINSVNAIHEFCNIINRSNGQIWMQDSNGQEYDLKNELSMYIVIGKLLYNPDHDLELYASDPNVQMRLVSFFHNQMRRSA